MKTLIVEDDFTCRLLLLEILTPYGSTHVAKNGAESVDTVRSALMAREPYDLICMDIMMPIMDGLEAVTRIRQMEYRVQLPETNRVRIVITSALHDTGHVSEAIRRGADYYLAKPFRKAKLFEVLYMEGLIARENIKFVKSLVLEGDFTSRSLLHEILLPYGEIHVALNEAEVVEAVRSTQSIGNYYDFVSLDITRPEIGGLSALKTIRLMEKMANTADQDCAKVFLSLPYQESNNYLTANQGQYSCLLYKPIMKKSVIADLFKLGLIS